MTCAPNPCIMEEKKQKQRFAAVLVFGGIAFYFGLTHFNTVVRWILGLLGLCTPALVGGVIAFLLNVPMCGIENLLKKLFYRQNPQKAGKLLRILSLLLTFVCIVVVVALVVLMLVPELQKSISSVIVQVQKHLPGAIDYLYSLGIDTTMLEQQLAAIDLKELAGQMINGATSMVGTVVGAVSATISVVGTALFSLVIALYILIDKENLSRQSKKLLYAFVKQPVADKIYHVGILVREVFGKFLSGQSIEAVVLGVLMFVALSLFRIPYASLIAVLTAVCAFIPYIGAFISCGIGVAVPGGSVHRESVHLPPRGGQFGGSGTPVDGDCGFGGRRGLRHSGHDLFHSGDGSGLYPPERDGQRPD